MRQPVAALASRLPTSCPKTRSKKSAAMSSPMPFISSRLQRHDDEVGKVDEKAQPARSEERRQRDGAQGPHGVLGLVEHVAHIVQPGVGVWVLVGLAACLDR
ncbi:hypothetical protein NOR_00590 [Metarhizium rileyi]|uniref:Uncharacterized protein n=1 Tax=Metarhizium rileyi (strain RCEF 4871) TaxID=1649241 RepID=A0A167KPG7_METRR|nr:hypothetical protein NOR_00590 [Metarhizium rileyi RCEF 4871]